jgi:hypothetical protein
MSTSTSNDLARPWSETTFNITNDPEKIEEARKIIENENNYTDKGYKMYLIYVRDNKQLTGKQMETLVKEDIDRTDNNKIFKLIPGRKLLKILNNAEVFKLYGGKSKNRRNKNKRRKSRNRKSRNRQSRNRKSRNRKYL